MLKNVETTYWCYKSFCIWVTIFPKGLPNLFSILETEVGCEIRLTNIGTNRCKKINKGLKEKPSVEFKRHCKKSYKTTFKFMVIFKVTVIADSGNRYANVDISNFPSSSACKLHSSAASDKIQ